MDFLSEFRRMNFRQMIYQALTFGMVISSAYMVWNFLKVVTNTPAPACVVLSGSMEPAFYRGDILLLTNYTSHEWTVGDIVVYNIEGRNIPIVHRAMNIHETKDKLLKMLTKGDNNQVHDRDLYAERQDWLKPADLIGKAFLQIPYAGYFTVFMADYPQFKIALIAMIGLSCLLWKES